MLIFTLIISPKTNKSYKIALFTTTIRPVFQKNWQKPLIFDFFIFFSPNVVEISAPFYASKTNHSPLSNIPFELDAYMAQDCQRPK